MIQLLTTVKIADNTSAMKGRCIKILGGSNKRVGNVGDIIVLSVIKVKPNGKYKKGEVVKGVIIRVKKKIGRPDGSFISTGENAVVLIKKDNVPVGTRIFGPVAAKELKNRNHTKLLTVARRHL